MKALLGALLAAQLALLAAPAPKKFAIARMAFALSDDGVASPADEQFRPGETIFFRCEVEGFQKTEKNEIHITYEVTAQDAGGK
jgi:hypothetical protein